MRNPFLLIIIIFLSANNALAQMSEYDSLSSLVYKNSYELLRKYELYSHFKNDSDYTKFQKLFRSKNSVIFNDIMPDNRLSEKVDLQEYLALAKKYYSKNVGVSLRVYEKSSISFDRDDYGSFVFHAKKIIDLHTINGIHYLDTFNVRIEIFFNHYLNLYWIADINSIDKNFKYIVVKPTINSLFRSKNLINDSVFTSTFEKYQVESNGYFLMKDIPPAKEILFIPQSNQVLFKKYKAPTYLSPFRKTNRVDKNIMPIKFNLFTSHIQFITELGLVKNSPVEIINNKEKVNVINKQSSSNKILLSLMYRKSKLGNWQLKFGAGFDLFTYDLYLPAYVDSYNSVDADGDPYLRTIKISELRESHSITYLIFPIILQKGLTFNKSTFSINAGYNLMKSLDANYRSDAKAQYSGYYDYLFNITISENGVYDFGNYNLKNISSQLLTNSLINAYSIGIEYAFNVNRFISINAGLNYRKSEDFLFKLNNLNLSKTAKDFKSITNVNNAFQLNYLSMFLALTVKL